MSLVDLNGRARGGRMMPSIGRMLIFAGGTALAAVIAVALAAGLGLDRAHQVLTRSSFSQDQLAIATELEADVNAFAARAAMNRSDARPVDLGPARVEALLARYAASIRAERQLVSSMNGEADDADAELATVAQLGRLFADIRRDAGKSAMADLSRDLDAFQALVRQVVGQEREEVSDAVLGFERTRALVRTLAFVLPLASAIAAIFGLWWLLARIKSPLRRFERAMAAVGRGEATHVEKQGLAEFDALADAFDHMAAEIDRQRTAIAEVNARLEQDVLSRTAELSARNDQLAEIEATRRSFFAQISHELRTPITALQCEAEIALRQKSPDVASLRDALEQVIVQGEFVRRRLADLLAISQAEDGRLLIAREAYDVGDALRGSLTLAQPFARANEARMQSAITDEPLVVMGDASWMQQAFLALLDNAIKFSPESVVSVALDRTADEVRFTIEDRGPGVEPTALPRLFDRFHQEPAGRARGGSGLGLSIARWVVDHHRGRIAASNHPHGGLRISINLPLVA